MDPSDPAVKRLRAKAGGSGVTGQLLEWRSKGLQAVGQIREEFAKGKQNLAKALERAYAAASKEPDSEVKGRIEEYGRLLERNTTLEKGVRSWTMANAEASYAEVVSVSEKLAGLARQLAEDKASYNVARKAELDASRKGKAESEKAMARSTKAYSDMPDHLRRFLYSKGALVSLPAQGQTGEADPQAAGEDAEDTAEADSEASRLASLRSNLPPLGRQDHELNPSEPALVPKGHDGVGQLLGQLVPALGEERIKKTISRVQAKARAASEEFLSVWVPPKGAPHDTLERLDWIPEGWKASGQIPEQLRGLGGPWLLATMPGSTRYEPGTLPLAGLGQFCQVLEGQLTVALWPLSSLQDLGAEVSNTWHFLFREMKRASFMTWADEVVRFCQLSPGDTLWVPYGWSGSWVTREGQMSVVLLQPYIQASFAKASPVLASCHRMHAESTATPEAAEIEPYRSHGQAWKVWLEESAGLAQGQPEDEAADEGETGAASSGRPALKDVSRAS
jgi:hypothetical protein